MCRWILYKVWRKKFFWLLMMVPEKAKSEDVRDVATSHYVGGKKNASNIFEKVVSSYYCRLISYLYHRYISCYSTYPESFNLKQREFVEKTTNMSYVLLCGWNENWLSCSYHDYFIFYLKSRLVASCLLSVSCRGGYLT